MIPCDDCQSQTREAVGRYRLTTIALDFDEESRRKAGNWVEWNLCAHCMRTRIYSTVKVERLGPPKDLPTASGKAA